MDKTCLMLRAYHIYYSVCEKCQCDSTAADSCIMGHSDNILQPEKLPVKAKSLEESFLTGITNKISLNGVFIEMIHISILEEEKLEMIF